MKKNFLKIHPLTILFLFLAFITGYFKYIIYLMSLIFIHELGHVSAGVMLGWKVEKIILLPFGGMSIFSEKINRPICEEFIVAITGFIYQLLFYFLLILLGYKTDLLTSINSFIIIFNLLPLYPLDGFKISILFFEKFLSFYYSYYIGVFISLILLFIGLFFCDSFLMLIIIFFLGYELFLFYKDIKKIFFKFLLERFLYDFHFKKSKIVLNEKQMKREYVHFFKVRNNLKNEKEILENKFGNEFFKI